MPHLSLHNLALIIATLGDYVLLVVLHGAPHSSALLITYQYTILLPALIWSWRCSRDNA